MAKGAFCRELIGLYDEMDQKKIFEKKWPGPLGVRKFQLFFFVFYRLDALPYVENQVSLYFLKEYIITNKMDL